MRTTERTTCWFISNVHLKSPTEDGTNSTEISTTSLITEMTSGRAQRKTALTAGRTSKRANQKTLGTLRSSDVDASTKLMSAGKLCSYYELAGARHKIGGCRFPVIPEKARPLRTIRFVNSVQYQCKWVLGHQCHLWSLCAYYSNTTTPTPLPQHYYSDTTTPTTTPVLVPQY